MDQTFNNGCLEACWVESFYHFIGCQSRHAKVYSLGEHWSDDRSDLDQSTKRGHRYSMEPALHFEDVS